MLWIKAWILGCCEKSKMVILLVQQSFLNGMQGQRKQKFWNPAQMHVTWLGQGFTHGSRIEQEKITCLAGISLCSGWLYFFPISYLRNIFVGHRQINVRVFKTVCVHCFCFSNAGVCVTWCMIKLLITKTLIQQKFLLYSKTLLTWATLGNKKRFKWAGLKLADRKRPKKWNKRILDLVGVTGDLSVNRAQVSRVLI